MQIFTSISQFRSEPKDTKFYSKVGLTISSGVYHLGLEENLKNMVNDCDCRILLITPDFDDTSWEISDEFESKVKLFNLDYLVIFSEEDKEFLEPRSFGLNVNFDWIDQSKAFFYLQIFNLLKFDKFYIGQKDFFSAKIISELIHDFNLGFELSVVENVREPNGVLSSSNYARYGNEEETVYQLLNKAIDFTLRMIHNGQKDVLMLEKLIDEYVASFKNFKLQKVIFLDALTLNEIGFIDGTRKIFFQLEARINGRKYIDNTLI